MKFPTTSAVLCLALASNGRCFVFQPANTKTTTTRKERQTRSLRVAHDVMKDDMDATSSSSINGRMLQKDVKNQLFESFSALSLVDQYDAVLTGLCAKIVDGTVETKQNSMEFLTDPLQLFQEMTEKRLVASPRSIMALIDATVKAQDASILASVLSLCLRNGGVVMYGSCLQDIRALPPTPSTRVQCPDGSYKTRQERLSSLDRIPIDERVGEVGAALTTVAVAGSCEMTDLVPGLHDISPVAHVVLTAMITVGILDNCYDLIQTASNFAVQQLGKDNENVKKIKLPAKEALPMGLGTGQVTGQVVRGFSRLLTVDPAREAQAEAAALFVAYSIGLPVFAFRSNALEASVLAVEKPNEMLSDTGILRLLMWLLAPVAAESALYPILIAADPREASGFLDRLEEVATTDRKVADALWWLGDAKERDDLLQWAFAEVNVLLRNNRKVVQELVERLEGGAATIGDCVAILERW